MTQPNLWLGIQAQLQGFSGRGHPGPAASGLGERREEKCGSEDEDGEITESPVCLLEGTASQSE